jgi:hypothetical protein
MQKELDHLSKCRDLIEQKLSWGKSEQWQNQDFENLSELILNETKVSLSSSTLKRIWGKVNYTSSPNLATLNVLAQFAGYENWRKFTSTHDDSFQHIEHAKQASRWAIKKSFIWIGSAGISLIVIFSILAFQKSEKLLTYDDIEFKSRPISKGLPNTILFQYNASNSNADSVFIQQSWDPRLRFKVAKDNHEYASTYYYPGYYRAKLILNDSVVGEHDLYVRTEKWLGTIDRNPIPLYINADQLMKNGIYAITEDDLHALNIELGKEIPQVSIFDVHDFGEISATDFEFETEVQSTYKAGDAVCQNTQIVILCSNGYFVIPLSIKGCVGELSLIMNEEEIKGSTTDLSSFGVDFNSWAKVKLTVHQQVATITVNDKVAYKGEVHGNAGKIVGLRYKFNGTGAVKSSIVKSPEDHSL